MRGCATIGAALLAGCVGTVEPADDAVVPTDTPTSTETDPPDSDVAVDSDLDDSDPPDSDEREPGVLPTAWGGGFVELAAPADPTRALSVIAGDFEAQRQPQSTVAFFADLDVDGVPEVVTATLRTSSDASESEYRVLRWTSVGLEDDDALTDAITPADTSFSGPEAPLAVADVDGDHLPDLLGGSADAAIRWGTAVGAFAPWTSLRTLEARTRGVAVAVADLDDDGWLDLLLGGGGCDPAGYVALRTGPRDFTLHDDLLLDATASAWSFAITTLEDGGVLLYVVDDAGTCFQADPRPRFFRRTDWTADGLPVFSGYDATPADAWWKQQPESAGQPIDAVTPMGAGFDDLDGDGRLDLVVTTGSRQQALLLGNGDGTFDDSAPAYERPTMFDKPEFPWSVAFPDVDDDGRPEILWSIGDDQTSYLLPRGHAMRNALSWNDGRLYLVDVEDEVGLTHEGSWHALGLADPDADGDADLVFGGHGVAPIVYRNDVDVEGRRGVTLRLVGTTSNPLAIGARIEARVADLPTRTTSVGALGNRLGTSEPLVFLGAGDHGAIDLLRITWPSGYVQEVTGLPAGSLQTITEPPTVEVLDADRHAEADGVASIVLRITPRTPAGDIDRQASVDVDFDGTRPIVSQALARGADGVWTLHVVSRAPGVSIAVVQIRGVAVRVRPKLWWDAP